MLTQIYPFTFSFNVILNKLVLYISMQPSSPVNDVLHLRQFLLQVQIFIQYIFHKDFTLTVSTHLGSIS